MKKIEFKKIDKTMSGNIQFKTTPYRWVILLIFCGLIIN